MTKIALRLLPVFAIGCVHTRYEPALGAASCPEVDESYHAAAPEDPACLLRAVDARFKARRQGQIVLRFAVDTGAQVRELSIVGNSVGADANDLAAVSGAVSACAWVPGTDPQGRAVRIFTVLPLEFASPVPPEPARPSAAPSAAPPGVAPGDDERSSPLPPGEGQGEGGHEAISPLPVGEGQGAGEHRGSPR